MLRFSLISTILVLLSSVFPSMFPLYAETWGESLFAEKSHDFGSVALGSDTVYRFAMTNGYEEDIRVLGVHSSCGCTMPGITKKTLHSRETGAIVARFNTTGQHTRDKSATLSVDLETTVRGQTLRETVLLSVSGYIRPDVILTPGIAEFGSIRQGQSVTKTVRLEYAGGGGWALTKIDRSNPFIQAKAEEIKRTANEVLYQITVTIKKDAPVGYVKDVLRCTTNETMSSGRKSEVIIPIQGMVRAPVQARPAPLMVGILEPGESVAKNIVVRSDVPFRIENVSARDKRFRFSYSQEESAIQLVSVTFSADQTLAPQHFRDEIRVQTNLPDQEFVTVEANAIIDRRQ